MPKVSLVTPSYNKPEYVMDAVNSVFKQTLTDWEYWLIDNSTDKETRTLLHHELPHDSRLNYLEFNFTDSQRARTYIPAHIVNQVYPELTGKYIFYLSDDDLINPLCFEIMVDYLESNPDVWVCYHNQERQVYRDHVWKPDGNLFSKNIYGLGSRFPNVDCSLDGGQIMHRRTCLRGIPQPYAPEDMVNASHSDGLLMQKLADKWPFHPVGTDIPLSIHRVTPKSTWSKP